MESDIKGNGWDLIDMDLESKIGQMEQSMKVNGKRIKLVVKANLHMQTVMYTKANGKMTKLMVLVLTFIQNLRLNTKVIGKMT